MTIILCLEFVDHYRDEIIDDSNENDANNYRIDDIKTFEYKTKIIWSTPGYNNTLDDEVVVPLKYFSNFWRFLDLYLINCKIGLDLPWPKV